MTTPEKAVETYGKDMQLTVAIKELSKLIKEICKSKRGSDNRDSIIEEIADCYIMLKQVEIIFNIHHDEMLDMLNSKMSRLKNRISGGT